MRRALAEALQVEPSTEELEEQGEDSFSLCSVHQPDAWRPPSHCTNFQAYVKGSAAALLRCFESHL